MCKMFLVETGFFWDNSFLVKFSANCISVFEGFFGRLPGFCLEEFSATDCEQ